MQYLASLPCTSLPENSAAQTVSYHFFNTFIKWYHPFFTFKVSWKNFICISHVTYTLHAILSVHFMVPVFTIHITIGEHYQLWSYSQHSVLRLCVAYTLLHLNIPISSFQKTKSAVTHQHETSYTTTQINR